MNNGRRYDKGALAISMIALAVSAIGVYANWITANQANINSNAAVSIASSAYGVANNYPPSIIVNGSELMLRRADGCLAMGGVPEKSLCDLAGNFNASISIIAPHAGRYNITFFDLGLNVSPHPVSYFVNGTLAFVERYNVSILPSPAIQTVAAWGDVPGNSQPFDKTVEIQVTGLSVVAPLSVILGPPITIQLGHLSMVLTYSDIALQRNTAQADFVIPASITIGYP
jgi:hypothetical protein